MARDKDSDAKKLKDMDARVQEALNVAYSYGQIDGAHHKMWVVDQMVRALLPDPELYSKWVEQYEFDLVDEDGKETLYETLEQQYEWDTGIAP